MFRIVCESYENFKKDFSPDNTDNYRYRITEPLELLLDLSLYNKERKKKSYKYKKLENFIFLLKENIVDYPSFKSFLWSLEARGIMGKDYCIMDDEEFSELQKIINMFLKLAYWG